ncbi:hypothetical protein JXR74_09180 [Candidatus Mcinerneyibacteriota bacterium]|nr:hypothetical protein [Candidatus Mcinerneyibacteriota bacterium]
MESYLEILHEIADIITNSEEMRHIVEEKPEELKKKETELNGLKVKSEEKEKRIEEARKELAGIDMDLNANRLLQKKYENQVLLVKKAKEMTALNNEIYNVKRIIDELTAKRHQKGQELETLTEEYNTAKEAYETMEEDLGRERSLVEEKISELKPEYEALKSMKTDLLKKLPPHVSGMVKTMEKTGKFQHIIMAPVNNGLCGVCKMQLPPQLVSEVRRAREVKQCPYCGRILFWDRT